MNTFVIEEIKHNEFDIAYPEWPDAIYMWAIRLKDGHFVTSSTMPYSEVVTLMKHYGVNSPAELSGKIFENDREDAASALDLFLVQIRHHGKYEPPTFYEVRERAARALARFEAPDFRDVDGTTLANAFAEVWDGMRANRDWLYSFLHRIEDISNHAVMAANYPADRFPMQVKGPAEYLVLMTEGHSQLFIMGPYTHPVQFMKE